VSDPTPPTAGGDAPRRTWDVVLTVGLLAIGAVSVIGTFAELADLAATIDEVYRIQGIEDAYGAPELANAVGFGVNVLRVAALLWAAALAIPRLRAGRVAFWIPLTAGVVGSLAIGIAMVALILGDPAFLAYVDEVATTGIVPTGTATP